MTTQFTEGSKITLTNQLRTVDSDKLVRPTALRPRRGSNVIKFDFRKLEKTQDGVLPALRVSPRGTSAFTQKVMEKKQREDRPEQAHAPSSESIHPRKTETTPEPRTDCGTTTSLENVAALASKSLKNVR